MRRADPSIEYLELFAVTVGVKLWIHRFANKEIFLFCDNMSVVHMLNRSSSKCKNCMVLIRIITLHSLIFNVKIRAKHVLTGDNGIADALSRLNLDRFHKLCAKERRMMDNEPHTMPAELWPIEKI